MRPNATSGNPGRTYRFLDTTKVEPLWPFGWGLSYTTFNIAFADHPKHPLTPTEASAWSLQVTNTGRHVGDVVVVCYVAAVRQTAVAAPPVRSVWDFARVESLLPGQTTMIHFTLSARARALASEAGEWVNPLGTYAVQCEAGGVAKTQKLSVTVQSGFEII